MQSHGDKHLLKLHKSHMQNLMELYHSCFDKKAICSLGLIGFFLQGILSQNHPFFPFASTVKKNLRILKLHRFRFHNEISMQNKISQ